MVPNPSQVVQILDIAKRAGKIIADIYQSNFEVEYKTDDSPVTNADKLANELIAKNLKEIFPLIPILSEEGEIPSFEVRKNWSLFWLVDPLDGTKEFVNRTDEFTVNIALIENNKPIFGVIHHPLRQVTFYAIKNHGAYRLEPTPILLPKKRMQPPNNYILKVAGSRSHSSDNFNKYLDNIKNNFESIEIKRLGSSYKFCMTAEGEIDIYPRFGKTMEWDTASGHIICQEVGIKLYQKYSSEELTYNKENLANPWFLAANEYLLERLLWIPR